MSGVEAQAAEAGKGAEGSPESAGDQHGSVVMLVGNDVVTDSRVKRIALSVARLGLKVTVIGYSPDGKRSLTTLGPVTILRVPVLWELRDARRRRKAAKRAWRPGVAYRDDRDRLAAKLRSHAAAREFAASRGRQLVRQQDHPGVASTASAILRAPLRRLRRQRLKAGALVIRGRDYAQRQVDRRFRQAWKVSDFGWSRVRVGARWRRLVPEMLDYELAFGPEIDRLAPDIIHAHDMHMVGVASNAVYRARLAGRSVRWIYDAHEYVRGLSTYGGRTPRVIAAYADLEAEYIRNADRVITVSPPIADALRRDYHLGKQPAVVLNTPSVDAVSFTSARSLRVDCGLADDVPLLVYSGGMTQARGVHTVVEALPELPGVHLALVCVPHSRTQFVNNLRVRVEQAGLADRVHLLDPVGPSEVVPFLASGDVGLIPGLHFPSHDMSLTNKLFEYIHAGLPVVVSDVRTHKEFVTQHGIGEVFVAEDAAGCAAAVRKVLADRERYLAAVRVPELRTTYCWQEQEKVLRSVYEDLLGAPLTLDPRISSDERQLEQIQPAVRNAGQPTLGIGPANMAGQAWEWAKAVERAWPQVRTEVFAVERNAHGFSADIRIAPRDWATSIAWQLRHRSHGLETWSHLLIEAGRPVFGTLNGRFFDSDLPTLEDAGIKVGLVFHGSEIRDPRLHRQLYSYSPFTDPGEELTRRLTINYNELRPRLDAVEGVPMFVTTPDLLDFLPQATLLPVVVDIAAWHPGPDPLVRRRPVLVHAPGSDQVRLIKGTDRYEPVLRELHDRGVIEYRPLIGLPHEELRRAVIDADIVLDQGPIGNYGVFACEAMSAGRLVLSFVDRRVRDRLTNTLPIMDVTPQTLAERIEEIVSDRDSVRKLAAEGPGFVADRHDGAMSVRVLAGFLGLPPVT